MSTMDQYKQPCNNWVIIPTAGNGDCLFNSIRIALASINYDHTIERLRGCVARRALNPTDEEFNQSLKMWCELAGASGSDLEIQRETLHVRNICHKPWPLSYEDRLDVMRRMMDPNYYWGDEVAVRTLERALQVRFLVWHMDFNCALQPTTMNEQFYVGSQPQTVDIYIVLMLSGGDTGAHYNPMAYKEKTVNGANEKLRFVFRKNTLPPDIKELFQEFL